MPISDLLASITGEKASTPATKRLARPSNSIPIKRKAEDDAGGSVQKTPRTVPPGSVRPSGDGSKTSYPAERPSSGYTGSARPSTTSTTTTSRPVAEKSASLASKKSTLTTNGKPSPTSASFPSTNRTVPSTSSITKRPSPISSQSPNSESAPKSQPKKGSYAEIKARAAAQQQKFQTIGKIQHKSIEKSKKELEEAAAEEARAAKKALKPGSRPGLPSRNGSNGVQHNGNGAVDRTKGLGPRGMTGKSGKAAAVDERKPKKAALATTGYTGSARPPPTKAKSVTSRPGVPVRPGIHDRERDKRPNPLGMFNKPRRRDDEYDEDMDDFVVDDEEEEEEEGYGHGHRYRYADEDDDSDMEAGYSDVEDEEARAARLARLEDQREEAILERQRREKEARKKAMLPARR